MARRQKNGFKKRKTEIESCLAVLYFTGCLVSLIFSIMIAIVWRYWKDVLNTCRPTGSHCNCILYASTYSRSVTGSQSFICKALTFAPIFPIIWGCIFGAYHTYRACIRRKKFSRRRTMEFDTDEERSQWKGEQSSWYIFLSTIAIAFTIFNLIIAFVVTQGYYATCSDYRRAVVKQLSASGNLAAMVQDRMSCGTVYDFLDYIQPDPEFLEAKYKRGTLIINSGLLLQIAIASSWLNVLNWVAISLFNVMLILRRKIL